jgi:hypothetical protein
MTATDLLRWRPIDAKATLVHPSNALSMPGGIRNVKGGGSAHYLDLDLLDTSVIRD